MKRIILGLLLTLTPSLIYSQTYTWATTDTAFNSTRGGGLAIDRSGNLIASELNSPGASIIKYNNNHQVIWRRDLQGWLFNLPVITTDSSKNIFIACSGTGLAMDSTITPVNGMILVKFDSLGNFLWYAKASGFIVVCYAVTTDSKGNVYTGGWFDTDAYFDTTHVTSPSVHYSFVAKYSPGGTLLWLRDVITDHNTLRGMVTDKAGNSYITGEFMRTVDFGNIILSTYGTSINLDIYFAKIDSSGNWKWVTHTGGSLDDEGRAIAQDRKGNLYVTGYIGSTTATFGTVTLTNTGAEDFFIAKYDTSGQVKWAINGGGPATQIGSDIAVLTSGDIYLGFNSKYISRFDSLGNYIWWQQEWASNDAMVTDNFNGVYISGLFQDSVTFSNYHLTAKSSGTNQMCIAYLSAFTPITADIAKTVHEGSLLVYPNPTSYSLTVQFANNINSDVILRIRNVSGQEVYLEMLKHSSFPKEIQLTGLSKGMYFVEVIQNETIHVKKIVLH